MTESKIDATDRLRREGRWGEASRYRDEERKRLKGEGKGRQEASEESWRLMLERFPPLAEAELPESNGEADGDGFDYAGLAEQFSGRSPDVARDVEWSYANLDNPNAADADPPSAGAPSMLRWARKNRDDFFKSFVAKLKPREEPDARTAASRDDGELTEREFEEMRKMLAEMMV